jgi:hypothetical protein
MESRGATLRGATKGIVYASPYFSGKQVAEAIQQNQLGESDPTDRSQMPQGQANVNFGNFDQQDNQDRTESERGNQLERTLHADQRRLRQRMLKKKLLQVT